MLTWMLAWLMLRRSWYAGKINFMHYFRITMNHVTSIVVKCHCESKLFFSKILILRYYNLICEKGITWIQHQFKLNLISIPKINFYNLSQQHQNQLLQRRIYDWFFTILIYFIAFSMCVSDTFTKSWKLSGRWVHILLFYDASSVSLLLGNFFHFVTNWNYLCHHSWFSSMRKKDAKRKKFKNEAWKRRRKKYDKNKTENVVANWHCKNGK